MSQNIIPSNVAHIYLDDTLIGAITDVRVSVDGKEMIFEQIGTPFITDNNVSGISIRIRATIGFLDSSMLNKMLSKVQTKDSDTYNDVLTSENVDLHQPTTESWFKVNRFTLKIHAKNKNDEPLIITISDVVFYRYELYFRAGDFWLQDVEAVGRMINYS